MTTEISKPRQWRRHNGETIATGTFLRLHANNARLRLEDGGHVDVPLVDLRRKDVALLLAPPKHANIIGVSALSSIIQDEDESPISITSENISSLVNSLNPIIWPAAQLCKSQNGSDPLLDACVTHATSYHERGVVGHDYVVLRIRARSAKHPNGLDFWIRCQRMPGAHGRRAHLPALCKLFGASQKIPAKDGVKFSADELQLRNKDDMFVSMSRFENVRLRHLLCLLDIIHSVSPSYDFLSHNSWWYADVIIKTLDRLGEDWDNRVKRSTWRSLTMALGPGVTQSTHEVAKIFVGKWKPDEVFVDTLSKPLLSPEPSDGTAYHDDMEKYSSFGDVGAKIPGSSTATIDPFVQTVRNLEVMYCSVAMLCGLIRSNPATREGRVKCLVRRRRITRMRHEFILLRVSIPDMTDLWIRLDRTPRAPKGPFTTMKLFKDAPTNDTSKVSEKEAKVLLDDASHITAIVEFRTPPTLDTVQRLLTVISEESTIYNVLGENCWFYSSVIQDVLTDWYDGILQGSLSHLKFGEDAHARIRSRKREIMNLSGYA